MISDPLFFLMLQADDYPSQATSVRRRFPATNDNQAAVATLV
jgi:hypothetical protein